MTIECKNCSMHEQCICEVSADECEIRKQSYNKAIDDFVKMLYEELLYEDGLTEIDVDYIAEQLKAGGKDE